MNLTFSEITAFFSPESQQALIDLAEQAKEERGSKWLEYLKEEYPLAPYILDLILNHSADEAYNILAADYPIAVIFKHQIFQVHHELKTQLQRKQFSL